MCVFEIKTLSLPCQTQAEAPNGVEVWGDIYIHKGVSVRFGFDGRRTSQTHRQVKNKAAGTPHGGVLYTVFTGYECFSHL